MLEHSMFLRFLIFLKVRYDFNCFTCAVFLCSEEELPYHNAAMERVSPALHLSTVTGESGLSEE